VARVSLPDAGRWDAEEGGEREAVEKEEGRHEEKEYEGPGGWGSARADSEI
jgi:hypothetical protein